MIVTMTVVSDLSLMISLGLQGPIRWLLLIGAVLPALGGAWSVFLLFINRPNPFIASHLVRTCDCPSIYFCVS